MIHNYSSGCPISYQVCLSLFLAFAPPALAESWTGYLVDQECAQSFRASANPLVTAREHARGCTKSLTAQIPAYYLFTEGQWLKLDKQGNSMAHNITRHSIREKGVLVTITGKLSPKMIEVTRIIELVDTPK